MATVILLKKLKNGISTSLFSKTTKSTQNKCLMIALNLTGRLQRLINLLRIRLNRIN